MIVNKLAEIYDLISLFITYITVNFHIVDNDVTLGFLFVALGIFYVSFNALVLIVRRGRHG